MFYNFNIQDTKNDEAMKLCKKMNRINFIKIHKGTILLVLSTLMFMILSMFTSNFLFLRIIASICGSLFIYSLYEVIINETGVYKKLSKVLNCSTFIKEINIKFHNNDEELEGIQIPSLEISYDSNNDKKDTAVIVRIDEGKYKILSFIGGDLNKKDAKLTISSEKFKNVLEELDAINGLIVVGICQINKQKNVGDYISEQDMDIRSFVTEILSIIN